MSQEEKKKTGKTSGTAGKKSAPSAANAKSASKAGTSTANKSTTKKPSAAQKPTVAKKPSTAQKPAAAKKPSTAQKPAAAKKPSAPKKPNAVMDENYKFKPDRVNDYSEGEYEEKTKLPDFLKKSKQPKSGVVSAPAPQEEVASAAAPTEEPIVPTEEPVIPTEPEPIEEPIVPTEPEPTEEPIVPTEPERTEEPIVPVEPESTEEPIVPTEPEPTEEPIMPVEPEKTEPEKTEESSISPEDAILLAGLAGLASDKSAESESTEPPVDEYGTSEPSESTLESDGGEYGDISESTELPANEYGTGESSSESLTGEYNTSEPSESTLESDGGEYGDISESTEPPVDEYGTTEPSESTLGNEGESDFVANEDGQMAFIEGAAQIEQTEDVQEEYVPQPTSDQYSFISSENEETKTGEVVPTVDEKAENAEPQKEMKENKADKKKKKLTKAEKKALKKERKLNKKKRGCCYHCCMTILIFNFVCACLLVSVGWIFGDQYCRQQLGMSLTETFGVVRGLTRSNGKFIDNAYTEQDEQGFYDSLGGALLLKEGTIDSEDLKTTIIDGLKEEDANLGDIMMDYAIDLFDRDNLDREKIDNIDAENPSADDFRLRITDKELAAFLGGIIESASDGLLSGYMEDANLDEYGIDTSKIVVKDYVKINQLKFFQKNYTINNVDTPVDMLRATVSIRFGKALGDVKSAIDYNVLVDYLTDQVGTDLGSAKFAIKAIGNGALGLVKSILPKTLYLTVDMGLSHSVEPDFYINNMGMGNRNMERLYKLLSIANNDVDVKDQINSAFTGDGAVKKALDSVNETVDLGSLIDAGENGGAIDCDIFETVIDLAKLNYHDVDGESVLKPESERLSSSDIVGAMKLVLSDSKEYSDKFKKEEYSYKSYRLENGQLVFDQTKYDTITGDEITKLEREYERELLKAFSDSYGLRTKTSDSESQPPETEESKKEYDVQDIIDEFSSGASADTLVDMFDADKIKDVVKDPDVRGVKINDRMLAAIFANMLPSLLDGGDTPVKSEDVDIEFIYLEKKPSGGIDHYIFNVAVGLKLGSMLGRMEGMNENITKLITNILADKLIVTMGMDITLKLDEEQRINPEISLNGLAAKAIDKLLAAFGVLKDDEGNAMTLGEFLEKNVLSKVTDVIDGLSDTLPGLSFTESTIVLPNVFDALATLLNKEDTPDEDKLGSEDVKAALELIINDGPLADNESDFHVFGDDTVYNAQYITNCEDEVLAEFHEQYGLNYIDVETKGSSRTLTLGQVLAVLGIGDKEKAGLDPNEELDIYSLIDATVLEAKAFEDSDKSEEVWKENLRLNLRNATLKDGTENKDMFSALIRAVMFSSASVDFGSIGDIEKDDLLYATITNEDGRRYLEIAVRVNISAIMESKTSEGENGEGDNKAINDFVKSLLPGTPSLVTLTVDITPNSEGGYHDKGIAINEDNGTDKSQKLFKLLRSFGVDIEESFGSVGDSIRDAFFEFEDKLGGNIKFEQKAVKLPDVFTLICDLEFNKEGEAEPVTASELKTSLMGIYSTSNTVVGETSRLNSFVASHMTGKSVELETASEEEFIADMKEKYFLTGEKVEAANDFDSLYNIISVGDFDASKINIDGGDPNADGYDAKKRSSMAYDTKDIDELKPLLDLESLGAIMKGKMPKDDPEAESSKYELHSINLDRDGEGHPVLILYIKLGLDGLFSDTEGNMSKLLNVDTIFVKVSTTIGVYTDEATKDSYVCDVVLNEMSAENQNSLFNVIKKLTGKDDLTSDIDKVKTDIGKAICEAIETLNTSFEGEVTYVTDGEPAQRGIQLIDIYSFLKKNMIKNTDYTAEDIRNAIQGMHEVDSTIEGVTGNYDVTDIIKNEIAESFDFDAVTALSSGVTDKQLGNYIKESLKSTVDAEIKQLSILAGDDIAGKQLEDRQWLDDLGYTVGDGTYAEDNSTYILMTVSVNVEKMLGDNKDGNIRALIPDDMFVTFILKHNNVKDEFEFVDYILNNMNKNSRDALIAMTGISQISDDGSGKEGTIGKQANDSLGVLNEQIGELTGLITEAAGGSVTLKHTFINSVSGDSRGSYKLV